MYYIVIILAVAAVYANAFFGAFQFDDFRVVVDSLAVHSWSGWLHDLPHGIRPVLKLSYVVNWESGLGLPGFHLVNLLIHAANALLLYAIIRHIATVAGQERKQASGTAFLTALLFALHPLQTEAVTYISGRSTSLSILFCLMAVLAFIRYGNIQSRIGMFVRHGVSVLFFVLALLTKETAVMLPALLVVIDKAQHPDRSWQRSLMACPAHWLVLIAAGVLVFFHPNQLDLLRFSFDIRSVGANLLSQVNGIVYLSSRLIIVDGMNIDPDLPVLAGWTPVLVLEAFSLVTFFCVGIVLLKKWPMIGLGILWFFIALLPTNSIVPRLDIANDRQLYCASAGLFLAIVSAGDVFYCKWEQAFPVLKRISMMFFLMVFIILEFYTIQRNSIYRTPIALWEDTRVKSPSKARVHNNLGYSYFAAGRYTDARSAYQTALVLKPDYPLARYNLHVLDSLSAVAK